MSRTERACAPAFRTRLVARQTTTGFHAHCRRFLSVRVDVPTANPGTMQAEETIALVLSGGIGLGAYQAGAYAALHAQQRLHPHWLAASSIGAVNSAVIAGSPAARRIERLRALWRYDE